MDFSKALSFIQQIQLDLYSKDSVKGCEVYFNKDYGIICTLYIGHAVPTMPYPFRFLNTMSREELNEEFKRLKEFSNNIE